MPSAVSSDVSSVLKEEREMQAGRDRKDGGMEDYEKGEVVASAENMERQEGQGQGRGLVDLK